jgi:threonine dehydratase
VTDAPPLDISPDGIAAAVDLIDPVFRQSPQFLAERLSARLERQVVVKVETLNPIGSFKGRGAWLLARTLDPGRTWVCSTAGNFGQGLAYAARARGAPVDAFVSPRVPGFKQDRLRAFGAQVFVAYDAEEGAREHAEGRPDRLLIVDGLHPEVTEGAGTIGIELARAGPFDTVIVQVGDGALISGVACWLRSVAPETRIVGVCAAGAPAMARSFAAGHPVATDGTDTIATALAVSRPIAASLRRVRALVDELILVEDDELRAAAELVAETVGVLVEPAGAAGVAALLRPRPEVPGERVAVLLTGSAA